MNYNYVGYLREDYLIRSVKLPEDESTNIKSQLIKNNSYEEARDLVEQFIEDGKSYNYFMNPSSYLKNCNSKNTYLFFTNPDDKKSVERWYCSKGSSCNFNRVK